jgi:GNAT superfamily N-acetyltransferase
MATQFRQLGPSETDHLAELVLEWHRLDGQSLDPAATRRELSRILEDNHGWHVWLVEHRGQAAGYLALNFKSGAMVESPRAYVSALYIVPSHRGLGIGRHARRLLSEVGRWLHIGIFEFGAEHDDKHIAALGRASGPVRRPEPSSAAWQAIA